MTYEDFRANIGRSGLSVAEVARLLHMHRNSVTNYAKVGEVPDHLAVIAVLLGDLADAGLDFRASLAKIEFHEKKPRGREFSASS